MMKRKGNVVPLASYLQYPSSVLCHCKTRSSQSHYQPASILERGHGLILPPGVSSSLLVLYGAVRPARQPRCPGTEGVQTPHHGCNANAEVMDHPNAPIHCILLTTRHDRGTGPSTCVMPVDNASGHRHRPDQLKPSDQRRQQARTLRL